MSDIGPLDNVEPRELVLAARRGDERVFLSAYGDTLLLLIRVDTELAAGLSQSALRAGEGRLPAPVAASMDFHTAIEPLDHVVASAVAATRRDDPEILARWIDAGHSFVAPLRKRPDADAAYLERLSVGRARNKDVVLRNPSVSKFHAWFEVDEIGAFHVTDAGSKNGTRVNGRSLAPRERTQVDSGDSIQFGVIDTVLCSPRVLRRGLRLARGGA